MLPGAAAILAVFAFANFAFAHAVFAQEAWPDTLPDNHLPCSLQRVDDGFAGACLALDGFEISLDLPASTSKSNLTLDDLLVLIQTNEVGGTVTYPNGRTTPIQYVIVDHRGRPDVYMKSSLGYFLWEGAAVGDQRLSFVIDFWYTPPATSADLEALELAERLLADPLAWHQEDDRQCEDDIENGRWSLFCALRYASIETMGEYNHHSTAMNTVRFVIDDIVPNHGFAHTLMDYNNLPSTTHADVMQILEIAKERVERLLR